MDAIPSLMVTGLQNSVFPPVEVRNVLEGGGGGGEELEHFYTIMDGEGTILQSMVVRETEEINLGHVEHCESKLQITPSLAAGCSNCLQKFGIGYELSKSFLIQSDNDDDESTETTLIEVDVVDALNYILRWRSFGITFQRHSGQRIQFDDNDTGLCKGCAGSLARLYNAVKAFDALTVIDSAVHHLTTTLLDTIVELASSSSSSWKNKSPTIEPSAPPPEPPTPSKAKGGYDTELKPSTKFVPYNPDYDRAPAETAYTAADVNVSSELFTEPHDNETLVEATPVPGDICEFKKRRVKEGVTYNCDKCTATFRKRNNLTRHLLLTHETGLGREKKFKCDYCNRAYHFHYLLKAHLRIHSEDRSEQCPKCPMKFKGKDGLFHHIKDVHRADGSMPRCRICLKNFKQERSLQEHLTMIHRFGNGPSQTFVSCPHCDGKFKRKRSMLAHVRKGQCNSQRIVKKTREFKPCRPKKVILRRRETDMDVYPCPFNCGKNFGRKSSMMSHVTHLCPLKPKEDFEFDEEPQLPEEINVKCDSRAGRLDEKIIRVQKK